MSERRARFPEARNLPRVFQRVRPYGTLGLASVVTLTLSALVGLLIPWHIGIVVDSVLGDAPVPPVVRGLLGDVVDSQYALLALVVVAGLLFTVLQNGLTVLNNYVGTRLKESIVLDFRSELFQHAQRLSLAYHDRERTGNLMNRLTFQSMSIGNVVLAGPPLLQNAVTLVGMFWIAFGIDPLLAGVSLSVVPFIYYSVGYYATHVDSRIRHVKTMEGQTLSIVHEAMAMLRVIAAFGRVRHEYTRFRRQGETALNARVRLTVDQTLFSLAVNSLTAIGTALVLGFGAVGVIDGRLTVGELLVVMSYIASVYTPLQAISGSIGTLKDQLIGVQMAFELLDTAPEIDDAPGAVDVEGVAGRVAFEAVEFAYRGRRHTLRDVTFEAEPGQVVAIVGPTGAGKSTLVGLIPRFYDAGQGRVTLDARDIRSIRLASLRRQVSIVHQEPLLFSTTIADNIRYGRLSATDDEIAEAARAANAHDFITRLPRGYDTEIGERGAQLSGGERQRVAIARAFLKDAPVLILDEPTSAIDSRTEHTILDALDRLMAGRTTFMVAHRLSTIRHADQILVMDHGTIVERGTHDALLARNGFYRQLHDAQQTHDTVRRPGLALPAAPVPEGAT
jgi:ATP-binding cassette subfamily B protein/subfamily B ATP-binding cassette protein MsbA